MIGFVLLTAFVIAAPLFIYPVLMMKILCFALFACAFNLLIGYVGLLSFGHALYFGWASYVCAYVGKVTGAVTPELAIITGPPCAGLAILGLSCAAADRDRDAARASISR